MLKFVPTKVKPALPVLVMTCHNAYLQTFGKKDTSEHYTALDHLRFGKLFCTGRMLWFEETELGEIDFFETAKWEIRITFRGTNLSAPSPSVSPSPEMNKIFPGSDAAESVPRDEAQEHERPETRL